VFFERPISLAFMTLCMLLVAGQIFFATLRAVRRRRSTREMPVGEAVAR
jgi:hypothetical protein